MSNQQQPTTDASRAAAPKKEEILSWEDLIGYPTGIYNSYKEMIYDEYGEHSEQAVDLDKSFRNAVELNKPKKEEDEEDHEYEYCNYGTETEPLFGELSYMVAGGGKTNGNAYATIELKDKIYYYCEYGKNASRQAVGNKIVWDDEIYDKENPYESRNFDIVDE